MLGLVPRAIRPGTNDDQDSDHELEDQPPNGQGHRGHNSTNPLEDQSPNGQGHRGHNSTNPPEDPEAAIPPIQDQPGPGFDADADESPHNVNNIVLGTALLWIGWFGFNGGSALGGNLRAVSACVSTHVAACAGGTTSLLLFWVWNTLARAGGAGEGKKGQKPPSVTHFCDGAVIGLVAITPAAGYVPAWSSGIIGVLSVVAVFFLKQFTKEMLTDDPLYVFAIHAGGGWVGMLLTGVFADPAVVGLDGYSTIPDRTIAGRLKYQMLDAFMGLFYTFFTTIAILYGLKAVHSIFKRGWTPVFREGDGHRRWRLEATRQHFYR